MLQELYAIQEILLKFTPQKGEPLREALDRLDMLIDEVSCDYESRN